MGGSAPGLSCFAFSTWLAGLRALTRSDTSPPRLLPFVSAMIFLPSSSDIFLSRRARREATDEITFGSMLPRLMAWRSFSKEMVFFRSMGFESVLSRSQTPTASTIIKWSFALASGVTDLRSSLLMIRTPRPFICSKKLLDFTLRMNMTTSRGLMSVPVAIMSTVTATLE